VESGLKARKPKAGGVTSGLTRRLASFHAPQSPQAQSSGSSWGKTSRRPWPTKEALDWWQADAWLETVPDVNCWCISTFVELLPGSLGGLVCWCLEGWPSAANRNLIWHRGLNGPTVILQYLMISTPHWALVLLWFLCEVDIPAIEVIFPVVLLLWRSACIGLKYAYFSPSDIQEVRRSVQWSETKRNARTVGAQRYFDAQGTLALDTLESLCKAAARLGLLPHIRERICNVGVENARTMWTFASTRLLLVEQHDDEVRLTVSDAESLDFCKYGDLREVFWLDDVAGVEELVEDGKVPLIVMAYYFASKAFRKLDLKRFRFIFVCSFFMCFLHPVMLFATNREPFGSTSAEIAIFVLRCIGVFIPFFQVMLFVNYPPIEGLKRIELANSILAAYGRGEARMNYLAGRAGYPQLDIENMDDLKAFWLLTRLVGPSYDVGILMRYNCAFVAVSVAFLCLTTAGLVISVRTGVTAWGVSAEFLVLYVTGAVSVFTASLLCMKLNDSVYLFEAVARRAGLEHPELADTAKDVCLDIVGEHVNLHQYRIMYVPAKPGLMSLLWSGMTLLTGVFISAMPNVCVPIFLLSSGCGE